MTRFLLIVSLVFSIVAVDAKPNKGPKGKGKAIKERFEAAKKKRDAKRAESKKKGHKHKGPRGEFGKLVRNDDKIKDLKKEFEVASKKLKGKFDRKQFKDATEEQKAALRDKIRATRKEWEELMKQHRVEVGKRIREIRKEFKNNRDKIIDMNKLDTLFP